MTPEKSVRLEVVPLQHRRQNRSTNCHTKATPDCTARGSFATEADPVTSWTMGRLMTSTCFAACARAGAESMRIGSAMATVRCMSRFLFYCDWWLASKRRIPSRKITTRARCSVARLDCRGRWGRRQELRRQGPSIRSELYPCSCLRFDFRTG